MNTKVNLAGVELKNPVMEGSGTFGSGAEYAVAGQSNAAYCGDSQRYAQCHRTSKSGN